MGEGWGEGEIRHPRHCEDLPLILSLSKDHPEPVQRRSNPAANHTQKILSIPFILFIQVKPGSPSPLTPTPLRPRKSPPYHHPCQVKTRQSTNRTTARGFRSTAIPSVKIANRRKSDRRRVLLQRPGRTRHSGRHNAACCDPALTGPGPSERNQGLNQLCVPTGRMLTTTRNLWRNPTNHHLTTHNTTQTHHPTTIITA